MDFKIAYKVENKLLAPELVFTAFDGEIGERFDRFIYERVSGEFAINEILREAEEFFAEQLDDEFHHGMWRGEFWGKLAISAARIANMKSDIGLAEDLRESAYTMLSYQREDGYLSTYRNNLDLFRRDPEISIRDVGWACDYNWNMWGQKYTLWGLIEIAMLTGDKKILKGAVKMADNILKTIEELGTRVKDTGVMDGMASSSIMKPMLILYRLTADERYLAFSIDIAHEMDRDDGENPNIIRLAREGKPVSDWYSREEGWYAKAYEMMSTLDGVAELYRITGEPSLLEAVRNFWETVNEKEANILGSVGYCEQLFDAKKYPDSATEICDVIHWMRLSYELLSITGEAKYAEAMERAFLNAFLAGVYEGGKWGAFFVRSSGRHYDALRQCESKYQHCCINNVGRGFANMAESVIMRGEDGYYVNSYVPSRIGLDGALFRIGGGYTYNGNVSISIRGVEPGSKVFLRVPEWSKETVLSVDGVKTKLKAGEYNGVVIESSETVLRISFDMSVRVCDFEGEYFEIPSTDYHRQRWCDSNGLCDRGAMVYRPMSVLYRGPLLLARSKKIGSTEEEMFSDKTVWGKSAVASAVTLRHDSLLALCRVELQYDGKTEELLMCDYASAANLSTSDGRFFSVFV